ncbi:hypothetical protein KB874_05370 [Aestuariicoccus sp. KMU-90]|uniref:Uncharacterized protein n=2 Tax=Thetidibacter halocola TaxID=2827239 RepID=A0A8J8B6P9_9RHOB|nr:hypothetical protein [Thetidibacter halocola]
MMEWIEVTKFQRKIGAIGFLEGKAVAVVAYYDDRDGNMDGKVSIGERIASFVSPISIEGSAVTEVAMSARFDMDVIERDASFGNMAVNMWLNFARGLVLDGIYAVYFSRGIKTVGKGVASTITKNAVKEFVIRKGFEKAVKEAFQEAVNR